MIKRHFAAILCLMLAATSLRAQEVRRAFVNMPDSILPTLTKVNRADCIDFLDSKMRALVKNRFDQQSEMTCLSEDYIAMQLSPMHVFEMKLLPTSDTTHVICTVQTVRSGAWDSRLKFYTSSWEPLDGEGFIGLPTQTDFLPDTIPAEVADTLSTPWESLRAEADILLMRASLADSTRVLTFGYTTPDYMSKKSGALIAPLLKRNAVRYEWKDGKFVRE